MVAEMRFLNIEGKSKENGVRNENTRKNMRKKHNGRQTNK
jgi:hypothetical protein